MRREGTLWARVAWLVLLGVAGVVSVLAVQGYVGGEDATERLDAVATRLAVEQRAPAVGVVQSGDADGSPGRGGSRGGGGSADAEASPAARAVAAIRERHLFAPAPAEAFRDVQGVLGDRVLYGGGQSFRAGDDAMGATVTRVGSDFVEFEHDGETVRIEVFGGGNGGGGGPGFGPGNGGERWRSRGGGDFSPTGDRRRRGRGGRSRPDRAEAPAEDAPASPDGAAD